MNQYNRLLVDAALCFGVLLGTLGDSHAQTLINLGTQSRNIDFTGAQIDTSNQDRIEPADDLFDWRFLS